MVDYKNDTRHACRSGHNRASLIHHTVSFLSDIVLCNRCCLSAAQIRPSARRVKAQAVSIGGHVSPSTNTLSSDSHLSIALAFCLGMTNISLAAPPRQSCRQTRPHLAQRL